MGAGFKEGTGGGAGGAGDGNWRTLFRLTRLYLRPTLLAVHLEGIMSILVIAKYHCEVADKATDDVDYQVRYFTTDNEDEVRHRLRSEEPTSYKNPSGEIVRWVFDDTVAIEHDPKFKDGVEMIGFI